MKHLSLIVAIFCSIGVSSTAVAQSCTLSNSDIQALSASPSQLTPAGFSALTPAYQQSVCKTRAFVNLVKAQNGVIKDVQAYSARYLSPSEKDLINKASDDLMTESYKAKKQGN